MGKSASSESPSASSRAVLLGESSADEETSFVRREAERSTLDYQSTRVEPREDAKKKKKNNGRAGQRDSDGVREDSVVDEQESWWAKIIADYGSIELENKGSVARDHLALGMTFFYLDRN